MRKTELTKEQQKEFSWLMEANTVNENIEVSKMGELVWKSGFWENGTWRCGIWKDGTWEDGVWEDGYWEDGIWKDGTWEDGTWEGGTWRDGLMWSNLKQKYIPVKWNKDKEEFEEDL